MNDIRIHAKLAAGEKEQLSRRLLKAMNASRDEESKSLLAKRKQAEHRLSVIASSLKSLYVDKCSGKMPEEVFYSLMKDFTKEQQELEETVVALSAQLKIVQHHEDEISEWLSLIQKQIDIETLDRLTVIELIESIEIGEKIKENGKRTQEIFIEYRFFSICYKTPKRTSLSFLNDALFGNLIVSC